MKKALLAYLAIGLLTFAPIMNAWFVADDWDFLILVAKATNPSICFVPLVGRFLRPLVMATYYVNYHLFGLQPFPYHVMLVLLHAVNAWLVCVLATRLGLSRLVAFGSGLIFLVFAGHTEAVTWVAGAADPWLILLLIPALLLFDRGLTAERPALPIAGACVMLAACVLAKESAAIGPPLIFVYGASRLLAPLTADERRRTIVRTLATVSISGAVAVASLVIRTRVFGSVFGAYSQLGMSRGMMLAEARAFALRSFLPAGGKLVALWLHGFDLILFAVAAVWIAVVFARRPETRRGLAFLIPAFAIGLGPALPLSISLINSVSERYVYVATVFSAILVAWAAEIVFARRRVLAGVAIGIFAAVHLVALERANQRWVVAGELARTITGELIDRVRAAPLTTRTLVMNLPDTVNGAFVVRGALYGSFHLMASDVAQPEQRVGMIASTAMVAATERTHVRQTGARSFSVAPEYASFAQTEPGAPHSDEYDFGRWEPTRYDITFKPSRHTLQVLFTSRGHIQTAAMLAGAPFGSLDLPQHDAECTRDPIRFSGWALADEPGVAVVLERLDSATGGSSPIGSATWKPGARPDVAAYFHDVAGADRAGWDYLLPCSLARSGGARLTVRVFAVGRDGQRTALGTRTVVAK